MELKGRKMKKKFLIVFVSVLIMINFVSAQTVQHIRWDNLMVIVNTRVTKLTNGFFGFSYVFENSNTSQQVMNKAIIELNDDWSENGGSLRNSVAPKEKDWGDFPTVGQKMRWVTNYDTTGLDFLELPPRSAILPGEKLSFSFEAQGLPGIGRFWAAGWAPWFYSEDTEDSLLNEGYTDSDLHPTDDQYFQGSAIVKVIPPVPFVPLNFLDTLNHYTTQSSNLGWITNQTTANKYLGYFATAKTQLQANNNAGARSTLQTVLTNAISDSTSSLTSEAYALIYYNTQYLLAQLPLPPSGLNVKLINSLGTKLTGGSLQYYDGSWKPAINNNDGTFTINTTLKTVSLQMTYAYGTQTKSNVTVSSDTVVFQTVNTQVKLQNSQGSLIDTGTVQYYAGAWRNFGTTTSGVATMELLPISYSFSMTYAFASNSKSQDLSLNPIVVFQTTNTSVQLKNSQGNLMDTGTVQYYSGAWRAFGTTINGTATKELLPNNYSFSMTYAFASNNKQQDIGANSTVVFQTVNAAVQLKNSQGSLIYIGPSFK
jgi:hypothetical protein